MNGLAISLGAELIGKPREAVGHSAAIAPATAELHVQGEVCIEADSGALAAGAKAGTALAPTVTAR